MNVGQLRKALERLPSDMEITAALCLPEDVWIDLVERHQDTIRRVQIRSGVNPHEFDHLFTAPYLTLAGSGEQQDIQFGSVSEPDYHLNRVALEF